MALVFDEKKAMEAAEILADVMNGSVPDSIVGAYELSKSIGEDNPLVEAIGANCQYYEGFFNEQLLPIVKTIYEYATGYAELSKTFNNLSVQRVAPAADVGSLQENNYDAAKNL